MKLFRNLLDVKVPKVISSVLRCIIHSEVIAVVYETFIPLVISTAYISKGIIRLNRNDIKRRGKSTFNGIS